MQNIKEMDSLYREIICILAAYENCNDDEEKYYLNQLRELREKGKSLGMTFGYGYIWTNIPRNSEFK